MTTVEKENQVQMPNTIVKKNNIKEHSEPAVQENEVMEEIPDAQKEQLEEDAEDQEEDSVQEISLEEANALFAAGTQALALSNYEEAAEKLSIAVEAQVNHYGQYAIEVAPAFYLYGKSLLSAAVQKNGVLGDQVKPPSSSGTDPAPTGEESKFVFEGDEEDDLEDDEGKVLDDIEIPLADDLELAWENLDLARLIFSQQEGNEYVLQLAEVHLSLGDVSLESENFDQAIKDYETALKLKLEFSSPEKYRELAEAHFKLGLAFEYSEQNEDAIDQISCAMGVLLNRLNALEASSGKGKEIASDSESENEEIKMLKGFLAELGSKRNDLQTLIEKEDEGEPLVPAITTKVDTSIKDISGLVKKRKTEPVDEVEKKAKLDN